MTPQASIQFGIVHTGNSESYATVDGRCHEGPIHKGRVFTLLSKATIQKTPECYGPVTLHPFCEVELKIESIWAYGHQINELSPGMTARLELSGTGIDQIKPDLVLT